MVYSNILQRVIQISVGGGTCTAFSYEFKDRQFLITARHSFKELGYPDEAIIEINKDDLWQKLKVSVYYHVNTNVDVVVLSFEEGMYVTPILEIETGMGHVTLSSDAYFIGFPYGMSTRDSGKINNGYPFPFIKKGIVSAYNTMNDVKICYLDGINNVGFSGGPAVIIKGKTTKVIGVVSSYRKNFTKVVDSNYNEVYLGEKKDKNYLLAYDNSGIIHVHSFSHVDEILKSNF